MRSTLIGILIGCGLAAFVAPALACSFNDSAQNSQTSTEQTAQSQPPAETGSN
jgi:hypothetical protein